MSNLKNTDKEDKNETRWLDKKKNRIIFISIIVVLGVLILVGLILGIYFGVTNDNRVRLSSRASSASRSITSQTICSNVIPGLCYCGGQSGFINALVGPATNPISGFSGDNGPALDARVNDPRMSVFDNSRCILYFYDRQNNRIRAVDFSTTTPIISTVVGTGTQVSYPQPQTPTTTDLAFVNSLCILLDGSLLIGQSVQNNSINGALILRFDPIANTLAYFTSPNVTGTSSGSTVQNATFPDVRGIVSDSDGNIYVVESNRIRKMIATSGIINGDSIISNFAGNGTNTAPFILDNATNLTNASTGSMSSIDIDASNNIYVYSLQSPNLLIYRFNSAGNLANIYRTDSSLVILFFAINRLNNQFWYSAADGGLYSTPLSDGSAQPIVRCQPGGLGSVGLLATSTTFGGRNIHFDRLGNCYCSINDTLNAFSAIRVITTFQLTP